MNDLTKGPVLKQILLFSIPMFLGNMLQQLYNIVDTSVVGRYVSSNALASVGSSFTLMTFITSIILGLCMGSSILFSMNYGGQQIKELRKNIVNAFYFIAFITLLLTIVTLVFVDSIIVLLHIPSTIVTMTKLYLTIIFIGIPAIFLYNFFSSYLKSVGNSTIPLLYLTLSTIVNIILDLLFVIIFHLGIKGVAIGTISAQYLSALCISIHVLKDQEIRKAFISIKPHIKDMRAIIRFSFMTSLQQSVMNLGILMIQGLVNSFGTTIMAAFSAGVKIDAFAYMPAQEFGNAFSTFIAQNQGAKKYERVKQGIKTSFIASSLYCGIASFLIYFYSSKLMTLFVNTSEVTIIKEGVRYLQIEGAFYIGIGLLFLFYGLYRAIGKPSYSLILTIISLGTRVLVAYMFSSLSVTAIWWAVPIGWILADIVGFIMLKYSYKNFS